MRHAKTLALAVVAMFSVTLAAHAEGDGYGRYDELFLEAVMQREKGNADAAFDLLRRCIEIDPSAAEAHYYIAQYYMAMRDKGTALAEFKRAAELAPDNATYLETLAQAYVNSGEYADAVATLEKLLEADGSRDDILEMLTQLYHQLGDYANTIRTLDRLELLLGRNERLSLAKSEIYTLQGDRQAAVDEVRRLSEQYPNDLNYRGMLGDAMLVNGQEDKAFAIYEEILAEEPGNGRAQMSMRTYYKQRGDTAQANAITMDLLLNPSVDNDTRTNLLRQEISENEKAGGDSTKILALFDSLLARPWASSDMAILCAVYMELKQMPDSATKPVLTLALAKSPDNASVRLRLVNQAWLADDLQEVVRLCKEARQYNPEEMAFYYYEGISHFRLGENDAALEAFQNGIGVIDSESDPDIVSDFYAVMGDILFDKGDAAAAYAAYDSCLQWKGDNIGCLNNYAYYLSVNGDSLDKAEAMSYRTVKAEPENATYLDTYAWVLFQQGRYSEARIYIDQAVKNDTDSSAVITEHAGDIHALCGDIEQAVELWRRAAAKDPDNKLLARKIRQRRYLKE